MAKRDVVIMGSPILREVSEEINIEEINSKEIQNLIKDLISTATGQEDEDFTTVGLAAPQIGISKRIFLVADEESTSKDPKFSVYINPEIEILADTMQTGRESCLSTPHLCGDVSRYTDIRITYYDVEGNRQRMNVRGQRAVVFQHETDHLDGILWIDKVSDTKTISYC